MKNSVFRTLRACLNWTVDFGLKEHRVDLPKTSRAVPPLRPRERFLTDDEIVRVWQESEKLVLKRSPIINSYLPIDSGVTARIIPLGPIS